MNKLSENGTFRSTATSFCSLVQTAAADLVLASARELQQNWQFVWEGVAWRPDAHP